MFTSVTQLQQNKPVKTMREFLGFSEADFAMESVESKSLPAPDLPIAEPVSQAEQIAQIVPSVLSVKAEPEITIQEFGSPLSRFLSRDLVRYPLIFVVAFGIFYIILNFQSISLQIQSWIQSPAKSDIANTEQASPEYLKWIQKYYVYVNDPQIFLANNDADEDGLKNLEEFYLGTNLLKADTDDDGYVDGQEILNGYNPLYSGALTPKEQSIIAENIDLTGIESRLNLYRSGRGGVSAVAGERAVGSTAGSGNSDSTDSRTTNSAAGIDAPDQVNSIRYSTSYAGSSSLPLDTFQIDPSKPGNIRIPKLGIDAPILWTADFDHMLDDLKYGVAHHPATPFPGQRGTSSIHGHSSGYPWDGNYKTVFTKLNFLEAGDEVFLTMYGTKGEVRKYRFLVRAKHVYEKNDAAQFADLGGYFLNLSTSWPVGTARERYVVTTELSGIE